MKKLRNWTLIIMMIIIIIAIVFGKSNVSLAAPDGTWQSSEATATLGGYKSGGANAWMTRYWNVYCLQKGAELTDGSVNHYVKYKVEIRGNTATFYKANGEVFGTVVTPENNVMAAILTPNSYIPSSVLSQTSRKHSDWWSIGMYVSSSAATWPSRTFADYSRAQLALYWYLDVWTSACSAKGVATGWTYNQGSGIKSYEDAEGGAGFCYDLAQVGTFNVDLYYLEASSFQNLLIANPYQATAGKPTQTTSVTVTKKWSDSNNAYGTRPDSVSVILKANGTNKSTVTLSSSNSWSYTFSNLPEYDSSGSKITYSATETVPTGYSASYSGTTITNTLQTTSVAVTKVWNDQSNRAGRRPTSVTVRLYADGSPATNASGETITATLNSSNSWKWTFSDLPQYIDGSAVTYTVQEDDIGNGYTKQITGSASSGFTITNTLQTVDVTVNKSWNDENDRDGLRPTSIDVTLYADGSPAKDANGNTITATLNSSNNWAYTFLYLLKEDTNGNTITYSVDENSVPSEYTKQVTKNSTNNFTITNTHETKKISVTVKKAWNDEDDLDDLRKSVTVTLYANGTKVTSDGYGNSITNPVTLSASNNWTYTFANLYKYEPVGQEITYSIKENALYTAQNAKGEIPYNQPKYSTSTDANGNKTLTVTNTHTPDYDGYIEITGTVWKDRDDGKANDINGIFDSDESGLSGIKVRLIDGNSNDVVIKATYTDKNGNFTRTDYAETDANGKYTIRVNYDNSQNVYKLYANAEKVKADLAYAYVEFEYDGFTYTTVASATSGSNTSKATEKPSTRTTIDDSYATVSKGGTRPSSTATQITATTKTMSTYTERETDNNRLEIIKYCKGNGKYDRTKYDDPTVVQTNLTHTCANHANHTGNTWKYGVVVEKIININLGLFEREQPEIGINEDLTKVEVEMNNQQYTYLYGVKNTNIKNSSSNQTQYMQAKFQNKYTYTYRRPVNPADVAYINKVNSNAMEVYVTYEIKVANLSPTLTIIFDEIVNVYDSQYVINKIQKGSTVLFDEENGTKSSNVQENATVYTPSTQFKQMKLTGLNIQLTGQKEAGDENTITIRYRIDQMKLPDLFNNNSPLNNAVEILKYTSKYGNDTLYAQQGKGGRTGNLYAGFDDASNLGNAGIYIKDGRLEATKSEPDTDIAPAFVLEKGETKTLAGTIWEDTRSDEIDQEDEERLGNGYIDSSEKGVKDVKIELYDINGNKARRFNDSEEEITDEPIYTDSNGNYQIPGIVTGEYYIKYTYGNDESDLGGRKTTIDGNEVNARNYKSTIITDTTIVDEESGTTFKKLFSKDSFTSAEKMWHITHADNYSVAVDDMTDRLSIGVLTNSTYDDGENMTAYTNPFESQVEFETSGSSQVDENGKNDNLKNVLDKLDFGIIERPREELIVQKTISYFKIILANGQVLTEGNPSDPNANISYAKTMGFSQDIDTVEEARNALEKRLLVEMDAELMQGAKLEVKYAVTVINNNEIDYDYGDISDYEDIQGTDYITASPMADYYYYGNKTYFNDDDIMKSTIRFVDYLDNDLVYNEDETKWEEITADDLKNGGFISTKEGNNVYAKLLEGEYRILQTPVDPDTGESSITIQRGIEFAFTQEMTTSKLLANKDDNVFDNHAEIIEIDGKTARTIKGKIIENGEIKQLEYVPGNYEPGTTSHEESETDDDKVDIMITPPTGITNYIITYVIAGLVGLIVILVAVVFIKKKVLIK